MTPLDYLKICEDCLKRMKIKVDYIFNMDEMIKTFCTLDITIDKEIFNI